MKFIQLVSPQTKMEVLPPHSVAWKIQKIQTFIQILRVITNEIYCVNSNVLCDFFCQMVVWVNGGGMTSWCSFLFFTSNSHKKVTQKSTSVFWNGLNSISARWNIFYINAVNWFAHFKQAHIITPVCIESDSTHLINLH